jgi:hypothetical protein
MRFRNRFPPTGEYTMRKQMKNLDHLTRHFLLAFALVCLSLLSCAAAYNINIVIFSILAIPLTILAAASAFAFIKSIKKKEIIQSTIYAIALLFAYIPLQNLFPWSEFSRSQTMKFRFDERRENYMALVNSKKIIWPQNKFFVFESEKIVFPGEVDERIVYDETDEIAYGPSTKLLNLIAQQSPDNFVKFNTCRWKAWELGGGFFAVDFYC